MADYTPSAVKPATIHLWDTNTLALGGLNGDACAVLKELANYSAYLESVKAPLADPALTGTPTAPTAAVGTNTDQVATTAFVQTAAQLAVPAGTVIYYAAATAPTGYLECNGSAKSRSAYPSLFAAIGTTFGAGDGSTTFNLPDIRGEFIRGWDNPAGDGGDIDPDRVYGSHQEDALKSHSHPTVNFMKSGSAFSLSNAAGYNVDNAQTTEAAGGTETRPRNIALLACIKY